MNKQIVQLLSLVLVFTFVSVDAIAQKKKKSKKGKEETTAKVELKNEIDSVSYAIGFSFGENLKKEFAEGNNDVVRAGLKAALESDTNALLQASQTQQIVGGYFQKKQQQAQAEEAKKYENAKAEGEKFLAENKTKPGVITTASGLQYIVLKEGTGNQPTATSNVEVHYHGTTPDGTVFDSSVDRGQSISFGLNQVIKGWTEGVQLMKEGAKYKFFIPQELAYGANAPQGGQGPIKPYMPLIFEVELIKINQ
ncbi:MAG: FKBP-type peptidyl-prolyl cis-trans isomerase [Vicingus serpentipes]|nr:FKBP-type peptidyl-prolyl cis-trans isomerase [Vicingus serpentipes]